MSIDHLISVSWGKSGKIPRDCQVERETTDVNTSETSMESIFGIVAGNFLQQIFCKMSLFQTAGLKDCLIIFS